MGVGRFPCVLMRQLRWRILKTRDITAADLSNVQRAHLIRFEVDYPNQMIVGVGDIDHIVDDNEAGWLAELRTLRFTIALSYIS